MDEDPPMLDCALDQCKTYNTKGMGQESILENPWLLMIVSDEYKTQEMCERVVLKEPQTLKCVPDEYKTREM